jgi:hypothetical protein
MAKTYASCKYSGFNGKYMVVRKFRQFNTIRWPRHKTYASCKFFENTRGAEAPTDALLKGQTPELQDYSKITGNKQASKRRIFRMDII